MDKRQEIRNEITKLCNGFDVAEDIANKITLHIWEAFHFGQEYERLNAASPTPIDDCNTSHYALTRSWPEPVAEPGGIGLELRPQCSNCVNWRRLEGDRARGYCNRHKIYTDGMEIYKCHEAV